MTAITINPMVVALRPTNGTIIRRIQPTEHGGGVKKVLAVVVAVAIPIAAPAIASSLVASAGISAISAFAATTVGAAVTSAVVGAGLGAISAKVMGGDVKSGAIMGAIGGGIGGYGVAQSTGAGLGNVADTGIQATANNTFGTTFGQTGTETAGLNTTDAGNTLTSDATGGTLADATTGEATLQNASFRNPEGVSDAAAKLSNNTTTGTAKTAMEQLGPDATFAAKSGAYMKDAGSALVSKVTDPASLASLTMQAGAQLLGAAMAPDPEMPPEQRELLEMRKTELAELKERDEAAFNAQMDAAKGFLQQAEQYDPTYMAFQAANKEAIDQQRKLREQYRKASLQSGGRDISEAEKRRMSLDSARNVSSRYDEGFQKGLTAQNQVTQAGLSAIPNSANFATYTNALQSLSQDTQKAEDAAIQASQGAGKNISDLFAGFNTTSGTGYGADSYWNSNKAKKKKKAGVNTNTFQGINGPVELKADNYA
jgi:hypothetical protein